jgi:hypothetical protein
VANGSDLVFNSEIFHTDAPEFTVSFVMRRDLIAEMATTCSAWLLLLLTTPNRYSASRNVPGWHLVV